MQFDDITREAVEVIQSVQGYSTVSEKWLKNMNERTKEEY